MAPDERCSSWLLRVPLQFNHLHFYDLSTEKPTQEAPAQEGDGTTDGKFLTPAFIAGPQSSKFEHNGLCSQNCRPGCGYCSTYSCVALVQHPCLFLTSLCQHQASVMEPCYGKLHPQHTVLGAKTKPQSTLNALFISSYLPEVTLKLGKYCHCLVKLWSCPDKDHRCQSPLFLLAEGPRDNGRQ